MPLRTTRARSAKVTSATSVNIADSSAKPVSAVSMTLSVSVTTAMTFRPSTSVDRFLAANELVNKGIEKDVP